MIYKIRYPEDNGTKFQMFRYPAGELQVRFTTNKQVADMLRATTINIVATIQDGEIMGLLLLIDAIRGMNRTPVLILPYLPYARADRRFTPGDCWGLSVFARQLNMALVDKVVTLDAHSQVSQTLIRNLVNVSPKPLIEEALELIPNKKTVILLPDEGAKRYGLTGLQCHKKRDPATGKLSGFEVPTETDFAEYDGALIVDDICDGGGTFAGIAEALPHRLELYLYVTHGIFSKGLEPLSSFKYIFTSDSLPQQKNLDGEKLHVLSGMGAILRTLLPTAELWANAAQEQGK